MFLDFVNFYWRFIQGFSKIDALFTSLLKISRLLNLALKAFNADDNKVVSNSDCRANKTIVNLSKNNKSKNLTYMPNIGATGDFIFQNSNAKKVFNNLWLAFIKTLILQHFDLKNYIEITTNISSYTICGLLS